MSSPEREKFDPSLTGSADHGIYGIGCAPGDAALVYIPVPWEVTTSYGKGTSRGPEIIRKASPQLDLYLRGVGNHYQRGFCLLDPEGEIVALNGRYKPIADAIQSALENHGSLEEFPELGDKLAAVNRASDRVNQLVYEQAARCDRAGQLCAVVGGDHSSPLGLIHFLADRHRGDFGILHLDAHHDLREAYQGFRHSHASIMHNVLALENRPRALVQVGIRDFCEEEAIRVENEPWVHSFYDEDINEALFRGDTYAAIVDRIIGQLPQQVYVSFDIDGLRPDLCPGTGTPVAGGLTVPQAQYLIKSLVKSGRRIIGFDLCEVAPDPARPDSEWDGNVGARILFMLSSWAMESLATGD